MLCPVPGALRDLAEGVEFSIELALANAFSAVTRTRQSIAPSFFETQNGETRRDLLWSLDAKSLDIVVDQSIPTVC